MRKFHRLNSTRGNMALVFALSTTVIGATVAGGMELVRVNDGKAELQTALDAAALAAAKLPATATNADRTLAATYAFNANLGTNPNVIPGSAGFTPDYTTPDRVRLDGSLRYSVLIGGGIFGDTHSISANATAGKVVAAVTAPTDCPDQPVMADAPPQTIPTAPPPPPLPAPLPASPPPPVSPPATAQACIIALTTNSNDNAFLFNSNNTLNAPNCELHSHGPGNASVMYNHGNSTTVARLRTKGGINAQSQSVPWMQSYAGNQVVNDPRATGLPQPSASSCTFNNFTPNISGGSITLQPGTYCGTTNLNANGATVVMQPGLYVIHNGDFNINNGRVNASGGVTVFMSTNHTFKLNGGSLDLRAPTSGTYAGLALYQRYGSGSSSLPSFDIQANQGIRIDGLVYLPQRHLQVNSDSNIRDASVQMIVGKLTLNSVRWNLTPYGAVSPPPPPAAPTPASYGPVFNYSFETPVIADNSWRLKSQGGAMADVPSWTSTRDIEFHRKATWSGGGGSGTDGDQYAEIEKDLSQSFALPNTGTYTISFDYRFGDNGTSTDNRIEVVWDGNVVTTLTPIQGEAWKTYSFNIVGTGVSRPLTLRQVAGANNSHGAFIDDVRVVAAVLPPPEPVGQSTGLVVNGSFETQVLPTGALWEGLTNPTGTGGPLMPGWSSTRFFEMWRNVNWHTGWGTDGSQHAELITDLSQAINLPIGSTYELSVDFKNGNDGTYHGNSLQILWNGQVLGHYYPPAGQTWKRVVVPLAGTGPGVLTLRQPPGSQDTDGVHLDRVRIFAKPNLVVPPPGCPGGAFLEQVGGKPLRLID